MRSFYSLDGAGPFFASQYSRPILKVIWWWLCCRSVSSHLPSWFDYAILSIDLEYVTSGIFRNCVSISPGVCMWLWWPLDWHGPPLWQSVRCSSRKIANSGSNYRIYTVLQPILKILEFLLEVNSFSLRYVLLILFNCYWARYVWLSSFNFASYKLKAWAFWQWDLGCGFLWFLHNYFIHMDC